MFYKIVYSKHAISTLNDYSSFIDKVISSAFIKDDVSHLVFNIRDNRDIDDGALANLMSDIKSLTSIFNHDLELNDLNQSSIRLNVQSPGAIEFLYRHSKSLILVGWLLTVPMVISCSHTRGENAQNGTAMVIQQEREDNLEAIRRTVRASNLEDDEKDSLVQIADVHYDSIVNTKKNMDTLGARVERLNQIE
ncbi:hypothetical protein [Flavobacterium sp.]|uniref:hypothetical protein n=1 Tax=Flavobacterium sp. TaxID=239 RepID=UPI00261DC705|nr:hypothetical protein [Flavobacterium sp.]